MRIESYQWEEKIIDEKLGRHNVLVSPLYGISQVKEIELRNEEKDKPVSVVVALSLQEEVVHVPITLLWNSKGYSHHGVMYIMPMQLNAKPINQMYRTIGPPYAY